MVAVLQVDDDGHVQVLVARGERQGAARYAVAHPSVLRQGLAQVSPGFRMVAPRNSAQSQHQVAAKARSQTQEINSDLAPLCLLFCNMRPG